MRPARELAHGLHPVQMARCDCDGGKTRAPGAWCAKVTAAIESRDRELVEAAAENAVEVAFRLTGCGITTLAEINHAIRALIPKEDTGAGGREPKA